MFDYIIQGMETVPVLLVECPSLCQICRPDMPYRDEETVFYLKLTGFGLSVQVVTSGKEADWMYLYPDSLMRSGESDTTNYWH